jgi:phage terminase Nu1 subunit (DNA packaging protein)
LRDTKRKNDIADGLLVPHDVIIDVLNQVTGSAATILDAVVPAIKRSFPETPAKLLRQVGSSIDAARNSIAAVKIDPPVEDDE